MISAEAPVLFAKAAEIFISELSLRAWIHTEDNKRRTLQVGIALFTSYSLPYKPLLFSHEQMLLFIPLDGMIGVYCFCQLGNFFLVNLSPF